LQGLGMPGKIGYDLGVRWMNPVTPVPIHIGKPV